MCETFSLTLQRFEMVSTFLTNSILISTSKKHYRIGKIIYRVFEIRDSTLRSPFSQEKVEKLQKFVFTINMLKRNLIYPTWF